MKKVVLRITITLVCLIIFYFLAVAHEEYKYRTTAEELIICIEQFSHTQGRLPNSVSELNLDYGMGLGPYYVKLDETSYWVLYVTGFDSNYVYSSKTNSWEHQP